MRSIVEEFAVAVNVLFAMEGVVLWLGRRKDGAGLRKKASQASPS